MIANIWLFNHDPNTHREPFSFIPERHLASDGQTAEPDPFDTLFGFGRRFCPGRLLADAFIWLAIATSLSTFHIGKARDEDGKEITPVYEATVDALSHPKPFKCSIVPRSPKLKKELVESAALIRDSQLPGPQKKMSDAEALLAIPMSYDMEDIPAEYRPH